MRLIDADALKDDLRESYNALKKIYEGLEHNDDRAICGGQIATFLEAILRVKEAPTIEADPVKHGRWENNTNDYPECNQCGYMPQYDPAIDDIFYSPYCPNCGCKMDLGG